MENNKNKDILEENTAKYIEYLLQGTGASINYEQVRQELSQNDSFNTSALDQSAGQSSMMNQSADGRSLNASLLTSPSLLSNAPPLSATMEQFKSFVKVFPLALSYSAAKRC
jgi:hypothetical protein